MKIFLSWSGTLSHTVAEAFEAWLPNVIQECDGAFISTEIEKGAPWFSTISAALEDSKLGITFITQENQLNPWLYFESGAIFSKVGNKQVCPVLIDLSKAQYKGPLSNLQLTDLSTDGDLWKLVLAVNGQADAPIRETLLQQSFERTSSDFLNQVTHAISELAIETELTHPRSLDDKVDEILLQVRSLARPRVAKDNRLNYSSRQVRAHEAAQFMRKAMADSEQSVDVLVNSKGGVRVFVQNDVDFASAERFISDLKRLGLYDGVSLLAVSQEDLLPSAEETDEPDNV
ncbi:TIR domain-containing protein [Pseudoclavibacter sp. CFCC 11306]|uniref:TIR domain-containing protein n=1 Tax=Pseudoclavibacter sp. CFCC 11306 TaxID=1564493 RepID=UPI0017883879|nr:TIR domain-containing protein [Pseudoclavibacter sp. CFCC 11306]